MDADFTAGPVTGPRFVITVTWSITQTCPITGCCSRAISVPSAPITAVTAVSPFTTIATVSAVSASVSTTAAAFTSRQQQISSGTWCGAGANHEPFYTYALPE